MKKCILICLLILEIGFCQFIIPERKIPDSLTLYFTTKKFNGIPHPIIHLRYPAAPSSKYWASDLHVDQICLKDTINIKVSGYDFIDHSKYHNMDGVSIFPAIKFSKKNIIIPESSLENQKTKIIIIELNNQKNIFEIYRNNLVIKLTPITLKNIEIQSHPIFDFTQVILFPEDVYRVYIAGYGGTKNSLINEIIDFGKKLGFILANDKYFQIPIGTMDTNVYFIVPDAYKYGLQLRRTRQLGYLQKYPKVEVYLAKITHFGDGL